MRTGDIGPEPPLHPLHALLLAFPVAGFTGALAFDITYLRTAGMQWSNFAAWLIVGGLIFGGIVTIWAIVRFLRRRSRPALVYLALVALMCLAGLINAFQHGRDAWSSVGTTGLILSILSALLALAAGWVGHAWRRA